jgi:integrase
MGNQKIGRSTRTVPFTSKDLKALRLILRDKPRDYALLVVGTNLALRGGELVGLKIGQIRHLCPGDVLYVYQQKTKRQRQVMVNKATFEAVQRLLASMKGDLDDSGYLFRSRKGGGKLCVPYLCHLVKSWARMLNLPGNYGSHSLRRSFGAIQRLEYGVSVEVLAKCYGHSSPAITMRYIGLTEQEVASVYMREI